jgi:hypothetical protein
VADAVVKRSISLPGTQAAQIDEARGDVAFSVWMQRAAEMRLRHEATGVDAPSGVRAVTQQVPTSAQARANVTPRPKRGK